MACAFHDLLQANAFDGIKLLDLGWVVNRNSLDGCHSFHYIYIFIYMYIYQMVRPQIPQHHRVDVTDFFTHFRNRVSTLVLVGFHHGFSRLLVDGVVLR